MSDRHEEGNLNLEQSAEKVLVPKVSIDLEVVDVNDKDVIGENLGSDGLNTNIESSVRPVSNVRPTLLPSMRS